MGTTTAEFIWLMKQIRQAVEKGLRSNPDLELGEHQVLYSYDNPRIHQGAQDDLEEIGISPLDRVPLPPYSPDMHKVIEHIHSNLGKALKRRLDEDSRICKPKHYAEVLQEEFYKMDTASIQSDIKSLKKTYNEIARRGGEWPHSCFR